MFTPSVGHMEVCHMLMTKPRAKNGNIARILCEPKMQSITGMALFFWFQTNISYHLEVIVVII